MNVLPDLTYRSSIRYWKKPTLDYNMYWILTVCLGWAGLDYFYLGSPLMGIAKMALTFLTFGYWWAYDAMNATFNQEQVEFAGPFVPAWGPTGIGAGRFTSKERPPPSDPEQAAKHTHFLLYGLGLFTLGLFGVDSYMTGDTLSGFIRLGSLLTIIFSPIAIIWYGFNIFRYTIRTDMCLDTFWDYFGAPKPADGADCPNVLEMFTIWVLKTVIVILNLIPGFGPLVSLVQGVIDSLEKAYKTALPILESSVETVKNAYKTVNHIQGMANKGTGTPEDYAAAAAAAAKAAQAAQAAAAVPPANSLKGGGHAPPETPFSASLSLLSVAVVGTVLVSAVTLTFWRAYQKVRNGSSSGSSKSQTPSTTGQRTGEEYDDVPPDPAVSGEPLSD